MGDAEKDQYRGRAVLDLRTWYHGGAQLKPGKSGITMAASNLPTLAAALKLALDRARELRLI